MKNGTYLIKFFERIRGALTAAPTRLLPVSQMPQAAPTMLKPNPNATPKEAHPYALMCVRTSDHPALQYSLLHTAGICSAIVGWLTPTPNFFIPVFLSRFCAGSLNPSREFYFPQLGRKISVAVSPMTASAL